MKNITLSAEDVLIERARMKAREDGTTLNAVFRLWLERYTEADLAERRYQELMNRLRHVKPGRSFSREEMNER
jgi:hypothetical protein